MILTTNTFIISIQLHNGPLLPDFNPYHLDPNGSSHFSNFVSYVPTPKPEWKRYKQYTKTDLMDAIEAVRNGMTALQVKNDERVREWDVVACFFTYLSLISA